MSTFTNHLRDEHREIIQMLDRLQIATDHLRKELTIGNLVNIELQLFALRRFVECDHHYKEESLLFPAMFETGKMNQGGPRCSFFMGLRMLKMKLSPVTDEVRSPIEQTCLGIPLEEHEECAATLEAACNLVLELKISRNTQVLSKLLSTLAQYQSNLRQHIEKEDTCLFVLADQVLSSETQQRLTSKIENDSYTRSKKMKFVIAAFSLIISVSVQAKTIEVKMLNAGKDGPMVFEPGFVQASPGDTIKFVPTHPSHSSSSAHIPAGAKPWTGKIDQPLSVKLDKEGVYIYKCDPHTIMGMVGVVQVGKATNLADAKTASDKLTPTFVMNQDRLKKYLANVK